MFGLSSFLCKAIALGPNLLTQQTRNTFILRRKWPLPLHKKGGKPIKMKNKHFIFDLVEDTDLRKKPNLQVVLKEFVAGVGAAGDTVTMSPNKAYRELLLPGYAVYATPENLEKYKVDENKPKTEDTYSTPYVQRTISILSNLVLQITMSKQEPWTLKPWHIRASFRKSGFVVPEYAIEMPPVQIKGPDLTLQEKEFYVTVTINNREKVNVRCRIHHWATGLDRIQWAEHHWTIPLEALIPEQAAVLAEMPLPKKPEKQGSKLSR